MSTLKSFVVAFVVFAVLVVIGAARLLAPLLITTKPLLSIHYMLMPIAFAGSSMPIKVTMTVPWLTSTKLLS